MNLSFEKGALLLLISAVVAMLSRRLRLPYSVGLVAAGIVVALLPFSPQVSLTKELLFTALLPPLIFEAAFQLNWKQLRVDLPVVLVLATVGVVLSAGVTAVGMHYLAGWQWLNALVFGVLIAATDPVSVIATFKEAKAQGRLLLIVESESLFNDGTGVAVFTAVLATILSGAPSIGDAGLRFLEIAVGGAVIGLAVGFLGLALLRFAADAPLEILATLVIETMCHFMTNYSTYTAVVNSIICTKIKERRL